MADFHLIGNAVEYQPESLAIRAVRRRCHTADFASRVHVLALLNDSTPRRRGTVMGFITEHQPKRPVLEHTQPLAPAFAVERLHARDNRNVVVRQLQFVHTPVRLDHLRTIA